MKRILLTGGAGFIAHHTIRHLLQNTDWEIVSLDRLDYSGNLNRIADMMNEFDKETKLSTLPPEEKILSFLIIVPA